MYVAALPGCGGGGGPAGNQAPGVDVTAPARPVEIGLSQGGTVRITYADTDPDDVASTDLVADADGDPDTTNDQILIEAGRPEQDGARQTVDWIVGGLPAGTYKILAITRDAARRAVSEAPGQVALNATSTLTITTPATHRVISRGGLLEISYTDDDPDDVALTWLAADRDGDPATVFDAVGSPVARPERDGVAQQAWLSLPDAVAGDVFHIVGTTWDGTNTPATAVAPGSVRVENMAWARQAGAGDELGFEEYGSDVATFDDGSCVVVGRCNRNAVFGEGEPGETTLVAGALTTFFLARYRADGSLDWAQTADYVTAVAGLANGSFLVTGGGTPLARYDARGEVVWAKLQGVGGSDIAALPDGSCVVVGTFEGTVTLGVGEPGERTLNAVGAEDLFVAGYAADGSLRWAKRGGGARTDMALAVAAFTDGSCVLTGITNDDDLFVARYAADGTRTWIRTTTADSPGDAVVADITAFSDGACAITGSFVTSLTFGSDEPGETTLASSTILGKLAHDLFLARYAADGTLSWARRVGGNVAHETGEGIAAIADGSCLVTGTVGYTTGHPESVLAVFGEGEPGETALPHDESRRIFLARYRADGTFARVTTTTGGWVHAPHGIATHRDGSCVVVGSYYSSGGDPLVFGPGAPHETSLAPNGDFYDIFVARFNADGGF